MKKHLILGLLSISSFGMHAQDGAEVCQGIAARFGTNNNVYANCIAQVQQRLNQTPEQAEAAEISQKIAAIKQWSNQMGSDCYRNSACPRMIKEYLKAKGTPMALEMLKKIENREL